MLALPEGSDGSSSASTLAPSFSDLQRFQELSPINTGNTLRKAAMRGSQTFSSLRDYPFGERKRQPGAANALAEVTYLYALLPAQLDGPGMKILDRPG